MNCDSCCPAADRPPMTHGPCPLVKHQRSIDLGQDRKSIGQHAGQDQKVPTPTLQALVQDPTSIGANVEDVGKSEDQATTQTKWSPLVIARPSKTDFNCLVEFFSGLRVQRDKLARLKSRLDENRTVIPLKSDPISR